MRERELTGDEKLERKERKRKMKDPSIAKKAPRQPVSFSEYLNICILMCTS
uniref:Uncharacterized protein n=1 Tax=Elaeophora elaphi TaxID=1147741 RepID=A0A0R3S6J9_9BILA